jgi:hypothetical protein
MLLALGDDVPPDAEILYFRRLGWFLASALAVFHHGTKASAAFRALLPASLQYLAG